MLALALAAALCASPEETTGPAEPPKKTVRRSIAATWWPVEPAVNAGFGFSGPGLVPFVGMSALVPVIPGLGPTFIARGLWSDVGTVSFAEGMTGIGVGWEGKMGDMRARASFVPTAVVTSVGGVDGVSVTPGVLVPLEVGLPLGFGMSFTGTFEPGIATPVLLFDGASLETGRDRLFVFVGAGVTFGGPVD